MKSISLDKKSIVLYYRVKSICWEGFGKSYISGFDKTCESPFRKRPESSSIPATVRKFVLLKHQFK